MLILSRRVGDAIRIADTIRIEVLEIRGNQVRIGIVAPTIVPVHREEIFLRIVSAQKQPLTSSAAHRACDYSAKPLDTRD
jgi:carbon storage regulator